jgi:hypothetical protein
MRRVERAGRSLQTGQTLVSKGQDYAQELLGGRVLVERIFWLGTVPLISARPE